MNLTSLLKELDRLKIKLYLEGEQLRVQAPKGTVTAELHRLIVENKAELLVALQPHQPDSAQVLPQVVSRPETRYEPFPLTDIQHAYWIGRNRALALGGVSTHGYLEFEYTDLNIERLTEALNMVIARHEMLRAVVLPTGQQQILADVAPYHIPLLDLRMVPKEKQAEKISAIRQELSDQVLPLDQSPLLDIRVTHLGDHCFLLHISVDILMFDIGSLYIFFEEWQTFYENPTAVLPAISLSFRDYVLAEEKIKSTVLYQKAREFWLKRIDSLPPGPELPLRQDPSTLTQQLFHRRTYRLEKERWQVLKTKVQQLGLSPSVLLLTAFALVLKTWCKRPHFTLNLTLFNRLPLHPEVNQLIGDFTSLSLIDIDYTTSISLVEQSQRLHRQLWEALEHRYFSGVEVMREIARRHGTPQVGLMPIVFTSAIGVTKNEQNALARPFHGEPSFGISQTPQVWLDHQVFEQEGGLMFNWDTVDALFPAGVLDDMFGAYCGLLQRLATDEAAWYAPHFSLMPEHQLEQRGAVNATDAPIADALLHTLFLQQVAAQGEEPAVITATMMLSYQELYVRANQVGHWLRGQGAKPNQLVAVVMEKGWEQVVAVLGIHLAGAAYLPIDPTLPTERRHFLLEEGEAVLALTQQKLNAELRWPDNITRLAVDSLPFDGSLPPLETVQCPTDLAYVIYTSGSTGRPKGVVIDHRGAVNTVLDVNRRYGVTAADRVLALSALNFDLSVYDIFGLLAAGGGIVLPDPARRIDPEHWHELIEQHGVTVWNTVPALMQMLVEYEEGRDEKRTRGRNGKSDGTHHLIQQNSAGCLQLVMLSGDWIPVTLPDRIKALWAGIKLYSLGGATEASIWSIDYPIGKVDPTWSSIPYGKPMTNQRFHVLDTQLNERPTWVPGDLYIGGIGLARGYWKDEGRTNARFINHPQTGERLYKTGDLGRYLPDGNIEFLGREDFQVKIRGHRIELGEIESALLQHPGIDEVVVSAAGDPKGHRQLVAYVVGNEHLKLEAKIGETIPYEALNGATLHDPVARLKFKLSQPGIRSRNGDMHTTVQLPQPEMNETLRSEWLARQSYRKFMDNPIGLEQFSRFLTCLMQIHGKNLPLPKYRYPSAGGLYPIQAYLYIKPKRVEGLDAGFYYYQPVDHQLQYISSEDGLLDKLFAAVNQPIYDQAAFTLFLVAALDAITPMYGDIGQRLCLLEAGYISQLLMMEAPKHDLGLCPVGTNASQSLENALALTKDHQLLHTLVGGRIDPRQQTVWMQDDTPKSTASWQSNLQTFLAAKLPDYMIPSLYIELETLPLTANGKVDRQALPIPQLAQIQKVFVAPDTNLEKQICTILCDFAGVNEVSTTHEFTELGLNSVHLVQIANRLRKELDTEIPIEAFFQYSTAQALATYLVQADGRMVVLKEEYAQIKTRQKSRAQVRLAQRRR